MKLSPSDFVTWNVIYSAFALCNYGCHTRGKQYSLYPENPVVSLLGLISLESIQLLKMPQT